MIRTAQTLRLEERPAGPSAASDFFLRSLFGKSQRTVESYRDVLGKLQENLQVPLEHATVRELQAALFAFSKRYGQSRLHLARSALRGLLKSVGKHSWLDHLPNPGVKWTPPEGPDPDEIDKLLAACKGDRERAVVLCSYSLAGRPGAIFGDPKVNKPPALAENIDWEHGTIRVHDKGAKENTLVFMQRRPQALKALKRHLGDRTNGPLFDLTCHGSYQLLVRIGRRAGLNKPIANGLRQRSRNICGNRLRHACAQNMRRQGADLFEIQAQLNHADVNTTTVYAHCNKEELVRRASSRSWR